VSAAAAAGDGRPLRLLAIDTSTSLGAVAVSDGERVVERRSQVRTHSEMLLGLIDAALAEAGFSAAALDGVACGAGPGSFTGLRIALATCKGLCLALGRPLVLVSSLEVLAARAPVAPGLTPSAPSNRSVVAALDAYRGEIYVARYAPGVDRPVPLTEERALTPAALAAELGALGAPVALVGEGILKHRELFTKLGDLVDEDPAPRAVDLVRLARPRFIAGAVEELASSVPRYLRPSEAERAREARAERKKPPG
jgi:tRNA threonylcarbamoyladenosine biosynthesis protein TsaB